MICYIGRASHSVIFVIEGGTSYAAVVLMSICSLDNAPLPAVIITETTKLVHKVTP